MAMMTLESTIEVRIVFFIMSTMMPFVLEGNKLIWMKVLYYSSISEILTTITITQYDDVTYLIMAPSMCSRAGTSSTR